MPAESGKWVLLATYAKCENISPKRTRVYIGSTAHSLFDTQEWNWEVSCRHSIFLCSQFDSVLSLSVLFKVHTQFFHQHPWNWVQIHRWELRKRWKIFISFAYTQLRACCSLLCINFSSCVRTTLDGTRSIEGKIWHQGNRFRWYRAAPPPQHRRLLVNSLHRRKWIFYR